MKDYSTTPRNPGTVHLIPGHPVMPICTGNDCPVCDLQGRPLLPTPEDTQTT
jgi:hypothetical protein